MDDATAKQNRTSLRHSLLDAEMNVWYWNKVTGRMTNQDRLMKFIVALTSSGAAISAWGIWQQHPTTWKIITGFTSIVALYHTFFYSSEQLKKCAALVGAWKELVIRYELLWLEDSTLSQPKSLKEYEKSKQRQGNRDETSFQRDSKLVLEAQEAVRRARGIKKYEG